MIHRRTSPALIGRRHDLCGANGSSPTPPAAALGRQARERAVLGAQRRQARDERVEHMRVRAAGLVQRRAQQLERRAVLVQQRLAVAVGGQRGEGEHDREVVRQLVGLELQAGLAVQALEPQQRGAAPARVAVLVVGEVQRHPAAQVESLHIARAQRRRVGQPVDEALECGAGLARRQRRDLVARARPSPSSG